MRNNGSNGQRLDSLEKDVRILKKEMEERKTDYNKILERNILDDLTKKRSFNTNKYEYTYEEIAEKNNVSKSFVQKIAEKYNLTRRNLNLVY